MPTKRLLDGMFIVTVLAMGCIQAALLVDKIDAPMYAGLLGAVVAGFLGLASKQDKV